MIHTVRPIFKKLLIAALVAYVAATAIALADLYSRTVNLQHTMMEASRPHTHQVTGIAR